MRKIPFQNFTEDSDGITARLAFEIPDDANDVLGQIGNHISGIKTEIEASTRFMKDFMEYLKDLPQIQKVAAQFQKEELDFLKNKLDLTQKISDVQSGGGSGGRSGTFVDSRGNVIFDSNQEVARRQQESNDTQQSQAPESIPTGGGTPPTRSPRAPSSQGPAAPSLLQGMPVSPRMQSLMDYRQQLSDQITDPRILFEHMRQRGNVKEELSGGQPNYSVQIGNKRVSAEELMKNPKLQSDALDQLAQQTMPSSPENGNVFQQTRAIAGVASNLLRSFGSGSSVTENVAGAGEAATKIGAMGSLGSIAGVASKVALPVAAAAGVMGLVQAGGEEYQNLKNLGQTHNQGFGGGFGYEMGIRMMSLNPFITTEQARQITMGALNLGYTGKEFDTVTDFMAQNLTDMNMSVADSVNLLKTNVQQGGESIQTLGTQLQSLQQLSGSSTSTNTQLQQAFQAVTKNLVSQNVSGNVAGAIGLNISAWNQQTLPDGSPNPLASSSATTFNNLTGNAAFLSRLGSQYAPGVEYPGVIGALSGSPGGASAVPQDIQNVMVQIAKQYPNNGTAASKANAITNFMMFMNQAYSAGWDENTASKWYDVLTGPSSNLPTSQVSAANQKLDATTVNGQQANTSGGKAAGETTNDPVLPTNPASGAYSNSVLTGLVNKYGFNSVVVYDPSGKQQTLDFSNKEMMMGIGNNTWKVGVKNSSGQVGTPADIDDWRTGTATPGGNDASGSGGSSSGGTFGLTPQAAQLLQLLPGGGTVGTDSTTVYSNTGTNGVTPNSAPVAYPSH